ncbi:carboxypeptidase regulatory-like domain-containing protein [Actinoplanes sp. NPDC049668]|uniref:carboxypeptidase regulatory-like domain-containing protein n=1 Tax=unclassified Actinoplanes TaxID=2626549 RepID=UPI0033B2A842
MVLRKAARVALAVGAGLGFVAFGVPAYADDAKSDLKTAIAFSSDLGKVGESITVTVTVTNNGTATATDTSVVREWDDALDWTSPPIAAGAKFDVAPGESKVFTRTGVVPQKAYDDGYVQVLYYFHATNENTNTNDNIAYRSIRVPGQLGDLTVYARDESTGAGVAGAKITVDERTSSPGNLSTELTTDADGVATLKAAPAGSYALRIKTPQGWKAEIPAAQTNISGKPATVTFRLERNGEPTVAPTATPSGSASATPVPTTTAPPAPGSGGGLPVTGSNAALVVGAGLGLVLIGAAAFLTARRRRTRFVSSN